MYSSTILIARLGSDPELRYTKNGDAACNLSVATTGKWLDQQGASQEKTTWHKVTAWKQLAELCNKYLSKGRLVFIEGEVVNSSWEDNEGQKHYSSEVRARRILFLDSSSKENK